MVRVYLKSKQGVAKGCWCMEVIFSHLAFLLHLLSNKLALGTQYFFYIYILIFLAIATYSSQPEH